jgi:glycosyltransferase involved in cell wall biosynthesis
MKILMSALACEPGKGSELEVGFRALIAAASQHDVWLLTNSATVPVLRRAIEPYDWADRVHLEGIYFDVDDALYPKLTAPGFHWYYDRWQRKAAVRAMELERRIDFDVVHHVTLAANWTASRSDRRRQTLCVGTCRRWCRTAAQSDQRTWLGRHVRRNGPIPCASAPRTRRARTSDQQRAVVIFAQNQDTARLMGVDDGRVRVMSNALSVDVRDIESTGIRRHDIVLAARLLPWKGGQLAVRSLRYVRHPEAVLRIFGDGPERSRIARAARRWAVADRVQFEGRVNRAGLLRTVATAGVFLHPAFHDEAGLAVAEALSLGTPVVCLDRGGPPELLRYWPGAHAAAIAPHSPTTTARAIAASIDRFLGDPPPVLPTPHTAATSFDQELLAAYQTAFAHRLETRRA